MLISQGNDHLTFLIYLLRLLKYATEIAAKHLNPKHLCILIYSYYINFFWDITQRPAGATVKLSCNSVFPVVFRQL